MNPQTSVQQPAKPTPLSVNNSHSPMRELFVKTDKAFIATLPRITFSGKMVVILSVAEAERAINMLSRETCVGFDTETRPSFHKGVSHKVALLQISTKDICFLFRLNCIGLPTCIVDFFSNPKVMKVGLSLKDDLAALRRRKPFTPCNFLDLQHLASEIGIQDMSLQKLYANIFHMRISKSAQLSNWEADVLTEAQKVYAATDAYTSLQLYEEMIQLQTEKIRWIRDNDLTDQNQPDPCTNIQH